MLVCDHRMLEERFGPALKYLLEVHCLVPTGNADCL